jgi:hypothetical protein
MASEKKTVLKIDDYEKGLLISVIVRSLTCGNDFSPDDIQKLNQIKAQLQKS